MIRISKSVRRHAFRNTAVALAALALSSCSVFKKDIVQYPCPKVFIVGEAGKLVRFKPGPGRDITDILFEANLANFVGSCLYTKEGVDIDLRVTIGVERGAASKEPAIAFEYFVAIPDLRPAATAKRILPVRGAFDGTRPRMVYQDDVKMFIPLAKGSDGPDFEIVLGFQLNPAEVEYNRSQNR